MKNQYNLGINLELVISESKSPIIVDLGVVSTSKLAEDKMRSSETLKEYAQIFVYSIESDKRSSLCISNKRKPNYGWYLILFLGTDIYQRTLLDTEDENGLKLIESSWSNLIPNQENTIEIINNLTSGGSNKALSAEMGKKLNELISQILNSNIIDLGSELKPHIACENIINHVKDNDIQDVTLFKYIDNENSSTFGICIKRLNGYGWSIYLMARKSIERLLFDRYGNRESWDTYGVLRNELERVTNDELECLSVKGVVNLLEQTKRELQSLTGNTNNNEVTTVDPYYNDGSGKIVPIRHPDLSTQPNILPYKFMGQYVYEQLIPYQGSTSFSKSILAVNKPLFLEASAFGVYGSCPCETMSLGGEDVFNIVTHNKNLGYWNYFKIVYTSMPEEGGYYGYNSY